MKPKLFDYLHLNAPLGFGELFSKCEGASHPYWSKNTPPAPGCFAERRGPELHFWYDQSSIDWKMKESMLLDEETYRKEIMPRFQEFKDILIEERELDASHLREFRDKVIPFWTWFDGLWWRIEYADKNKLDTSGMMKIRKETEYFVPGFNAVVRKSFKKIAGPTYEKYVEVLMFDEVITGQYPQIEVLEKRLEKCAVVQGRIFDSLEEVVAECDVELQKDETVLSDGILSGQCAYPGKVKGKVKIVKSREDMNGFDQGDIIVSPTTTPDFVPIMKIAGAIISEHGGVICHAAITSRELKIPCVVGVRNATKFLKNGDMVEVDAENGIVRVLK